MVGRGSSPCVDSSSPRAVDGRSAGWCRRPRRPRSSRGPRRPRAGSRTRASGRPARRPGPGRRRSRSPTAAARRCASRASSHRWALASDPPRQCASTTRGRWYAGHRQHRAHRDRQTTATAVARSASRGRSGVWKRFGTTDVVPTCRSTSRPGELLGFLGPNGAGKTTTMRMILDIIRPDRGHDQRLRQAARRRAPDARRLPARGSRPVPRRARPRHADLLRRAARACPTSAARERATAAARGGRPRRLADQEGGRAVARHAPEGAAHRDDHQRAGPAHRRRAVPGPRPGQRGDAQGRAARATRPRRGRGHEHPRHGRRAAAVRPDPADRQRAGGCCTARSTTSAARSATARSRSSGKTSPTDPDVPRSVSHATAYDGSVRYLLRDGATAQDLFRELADTGAVVERFAVEAPNLAEIFVRAVAGDPRAERAHERSQVELARQLPAPGRARRAARLPAHGPPARLHLRARCCCRSAMALSLSAISASSPQRRSDRRDRAGTDRGRQRVGRATRRPIRR